MIYRERMTHDNTSRDWYIATKRYRALCRSARVNAVHMYTAINNRREGDALALLELQSRFGDKPPKLEVVCPPNGTAVLKVNL